MEKKPNRENYCLLMEQELKEIQKAGVVPSLLLHSCCAPCSSHVISVLMPYFDLTILYYNPNIEPRAEYEKRKQEQLRFLREAPHTNRLELLDCEYDPALFHEAVRGLEHIREGGERCFACYSLRLEKTALTAKEAGFDYFTTTLSVSPYKNAEKLNEIGRQMEAFYGIRYLPADFKKKNGYKHSIELSRQYSLYRQDYCGCVYSRLEREQQKEEHSGCAACKELQEKVLTGQVVL